MEYTIVRHHRRKRLVVVVSASGKVTVKAATLTDDKKIKDFVNRHKDWIEKQQRHFAEKYHHRISLSEEDRERLKIQLLPQMTELVERYSKIMDVKPAGIKITSAEKRWGSCSSKQKVCFSYRAALVSDRCKEYLVVHELSHLRHMDHSKAFYKEVAKYLPDHRDREKELDGYYIHLEE